MSYQIKPILPKSTDVSNSHKIHALMVAAGSGSRYGSTIPKQYQQINGKPMLLHSLARLSAGAKDLSGVTLVLSADDHRADGLMEKFSQAAGMLIKRAVGGAERWKSVANGVAAIRAAGAADHDWVLIHDAARPCLAAEDLAALVSQLRILDQQAFGRCKADIDEQVIDHHSAAILATPVVDTLKMVVEGQVSHTVSRDNLWQALTPQAFRLKQLERVLNWVRDEALMITDEASAFELAGLAVTVVAGSRMNMKLTYAEDLALMTLILTQFFGESSADDQQVDTSYAAKLT